MIRQSRRGEFDLISDVFAPLSSGYAGSFNLEDDAAVVRFVKDRELVFTADAVVEDVHFRGADKPGLISRKALRVNLSDLAAMGAEPLGYMMTVALPERFDDYWIEAFAEGLGQDQEAFAMHLIGGDTVRTSGPLVVSITAIGHVTKGQFLRRSGAKEGDAIYVSGSIGDGSLGLAALNGQLPDLSTSDITYLSERYHLPEPRLLLGQQLVGISNATIDISDGIVADLKHICDTSGAGASIYLEHVPLSPAGHAAVDSLPDWRVRALVGGDDYELLFCVSRGAAKDIDTLARRLNLPLTCIGQITADPGVFVLDEHSEIIKIPNSGFSHF